MERSPLFPTPLQTAAITLRDLIPLGLCFALIAAVGFLPPDMSLAEIDRRGRINVCMPVGYDPLVTGDVNAPGFEVELVREIAARAGWTIGIVSNASMGRDFNPRSWRITRAQCQMVAGGVALTHATRSFMDTSQGHLQTGWMMVTAGPQVAPQPGQRVGFYGGMTGLDRIQLGQYLRNRDVQTQIIPTAPGMRERLENDAIDMAISEALIVAHTFESEAWTTSWLPPELGRFTLGFGFWRGDTTLRHRIEGIMRLLESEGFIDELADRYGIDSDLLCHTYSADC